MKRTGRPEIDDAHADWIIGSDESGYGTWAGELIVVGVAAHPGWSDPSVTDSKDLTDEARRLIVRRYHRNASFPKVVHRTPSSRIDEVGVWASLICAHNSVHEALAIRLRAVQPATRLLHVADGLENARRRLLPFVNPLTDADAIVPAVSLASCFAKVIQCELMIQAAATYPGYHFETSHGYGTERHRNALDRLGPCPIHRRSFRPIAKLLERSSEGHLPPHDVPPAHR